MTNIRPTSAHTSAYHPQGRQSSPRLYRCWKHVHPRFHTLLTNGEYFRQGTGPPSKLTQGNPFRRAAPLVMATPALAGTTPTLVCCSYGASAGSKTATVLLQAPNFECIFKFEVPKEFNPENLRLPFGHSLPPPRPRPMHFSLN